MRVLLFVGGLLVLGFVLGGQAHAAEQPGVGSPLERVAPAAGPAGQLRDVAEPLTEGAAEPLGPGAEDAEDAERALKPVTEPVTDPVAERVTKPAVEQAAEQTAEQTVDRVVDPAVEHVARPVVEPVAGAVGQVVHDVAEPVGDVVGSVVEDVPARPLPAPVWPGDGLPVPGQDRPQDTAPVTGHRDEPRFGESAGRGRTKGSKAVATPSHELRYATTYAHRLGAADTRAVPLLGDGTRDGRLPDLPGRFPAGPGGSAVVQSAGDGHTPRPGDHHAAWFSNAVAFGLEPGSRQPLTGAGVRDRHRDILEFPG
ncbi:hypothetical protein ACWGI8_03870 [Streptomyces sp. NPDC054841]